MNTQLGMAKVYFNLGDFGKMLKLKDIDNLAITDIQKNESDGRLVISLVTPMDNATNNRVVCTTNPYDVPLRKIDIQEIKDIDTIEINQFIQFIQEEILDVEYEDIFQWLIDNKYLLDEETPYEDKIKNGLLEVNNRSFIAYDLKEYHIVDILVTPYGQIDIVEKLRKRILGIK